MHKVIYFALFFVAFASISPDAPNACSLVGADGPTDILDWTVNNAIAPEDRIYGRRFDIPTEAPASPLFGAEPFTQQLLRFEEFGLRPLDLQTSACDSGNCDSFPSPADAESFPDTDELDSFLVQDIFPLPTVAANTEDKNPWIPTLEDFFTNSKLGIRESPAEGRPSNKDWNHQRWDEFTPDNFVVTATAGARVNNGFRNNLQQHGYAVGEFGPGGLYNSPTTGAEPRFHPNMPIQNPESLWTFDGTFPPKLVMNRYGVPLLFRDYNALSIDARANAGFGVHTLSLHEHNGHNPAESDGYTNAFFFPGQFYDYRWPMALAGHDGINNDASEPRAAGVDGTQIPGDFRETMSTHWMHDHMLDFTAQNVYKGVFGMLNFYSAMDRGNEAIDDGVNLRFPSGSALSWGNRDYDVNIAIADKAFSPDGQLWFNPDNKIGFIGDVMTVNLLYKPVLDVRARRYRFRILDASVSRFFKVALVTETGVPVPFYMIANDGNIMEHSVYYADGTLPTIGIGERYDIVVDFAGYEGQSLYFVNLMAHKTGQSIDRIVDLSEVNSGSYYGVWDDAAQSYTADPAVGRFMRFDVVAYTGTDLSVDPAVFLPATGNTMIPRNFPTQAELEGAKHRSFEYEKTEKELPWAIATDGAFEALNTDPIVNTANPTSGTVEVWRLVNSGTWSHPVHIHVEEGIILAKDGQLPPEHERWARKDVFRLGPAVESGTVIEIAYRFRDFNGTYMNHCHNTVHEDKAMLIRWDINNPGNLQTLYAPIPCWQGVTFQDSELYETARTGDGGFFDENGDGFGPSLNPVKQWFKAGRILDLPDHVEHTNIADVELGDALNPTDDERFAMELELSVGTNVAADGTETEVYFIFHDISDEELADEFGIAYAGAMNNAPDEATSRAIYNAGKWKFFGDLPPPVGSAGPQHAANDYTSLRKVVIRGRQVYANTFFIWWGPNEGEHLRLHTPCNLPDDPPNTSCMYNGEIWGQTTGHAIGYNLEATPPTVTMKTHKSWTDEADYLPYYIVVDSFPAGTANAMGIVAVFKHKFLDTVAVPLVQFLPPSRINPSYPPTDADGNGLLGGGPLGGQIGLPSYFMPGPNYSPYWHIGFAHWKVPATHVVKGFRDLKELREDGLIEIREFPPVPFAHTNLDDYDFANPNSPHVVNCPTPYTVDKLIHDARRMHFQSQEDAATILTNQAARQGDLSNSHSGDHSGASTVASCILATFFMMVALFF